MVQAAWQAQVDPDRLSFTAALVQVQEAIDDGMTFAPERGPRRLAGLLARLSQAILPAPLTDQSARDQANLEKGQTQEASCAAACAFPT
jgi:hypothetical protein